MTKTKFIWLLVSMIFIPFLAGQYTQIEKKDQKIEEISRTITDMKGRSFAVGVIHTTAKYDPSPKEQQFQGKEE